MWHVACIYRGGLMWHVACIYRGGLMWHAVCIYRGGLMWHTNARVKLEKTGPGLHISQINCVVLCTVCV
jgi:hypothetical protein